MTVRGGAGDVLVARGVRREYRAGDTRVVALRGLDLAVAGGSFVSVVGPSGSGKTTLLHCLSGLDEVDGGSVEIRGENVHRLSETRKAALRARLMGFVFQALNLVPVFGAAENVEVPLILGGVPPKRARQEALAALGRVGLSHRADHRPGELSGGEQQRVAVARAFVTRPEIVWADEPTGNLDTASARQVVDLLSELRDEGTTLVLVTHDENVAARSERRLVMRDGAVVEDSAPRPVPPGGGEGDPG